MCVCVLRLRLRFEGGLRVGGWGLGVEGLRVWGLRVWGLGVEVEGCGEGFEV